MSFYHITSRECAKYEVNNISVSFRSNDWSLGFRLAPGTARHQVSPVSKTLWGLQPRPQGFSLKKWVGREKALASAGHVHSLNIPEKLIYMQPAGFALTEFERSNNGK